MTTLSQLAARLGEIRATRDEYQPILDAIDVAERNAREELFAAMTATGADRVNGGSFHAIVAAHTKAVMTDETALTHALEERGQLHLCRKTGLDLALVKQVTNGRELPGLSYIATPRLEIRAKKDGT